MKLADYLKEQFAELSISLWHKDEKTALMRVIHGLFVADNEIDKLEKKYFLKLLDGLNVDARAVDDMPMDEAFEVLAKDKLKNRLLYIFMAEALLRDNDYDEIEQSYVDDLKQHYPLSDELLDAAITQVRNKKLEGVLKDWVKEIQESQY
ncbi:MAG: hypothetical protein PVH46_06430 [Granulosicoccaceae bacterium]|jgi:hypothetical protein